MKEFTWDVREPTASSFIHYQNLLELHQITLGWVLDIESIIRADRETPHRLRRIFVSKIPDRVWKMLETVPTHTGKTLSDVIQDEEPSEFLRKLENSITTIQKWVLQILLETTPDKERIAMLSQIGKSTWNAGLRYGEKHWKNIPSTVEKDIRTVLFPFSSTPLSGYPHGTTLLQIRSLPSEISFELLKCPHQEVSNLDFSNELCRLHLEWIRGFLHSLSPKIRVEYFSCGSGNTKAGRCTMKWFLSLR